MDLIKMKIFCGRKGFEIQFNWIFVLIAGAAILLFFSLIVMKQKDISESSKQAGILKGIEAIMSSASVTIDTTNLVEIPGSEINIDCDSISAGKITKQYQNIMIFSPSLIKGDRIVTQTLAFSSPYRSSGLLYVTSDKMRYIIIGNNDLAKDINKTLPKELSKEFFKTYPASLGESKSYKARLIFTENANLPSLNIPSSLAKMKNEDVTAIKITGNNEKGALDFYRMEDAGGSKRWALASSSQYIGKAPLIGGVYTDTKELYECSMKDAFARHNLVAKIYISRTDKLKAGVTNADCQGVYTNSLNLLNLISGASVALAANIDSAGMQNLLDASGQLASQNDRAQKFSCPLVY